MAQEIDAGRIVAEIVLETQQAREEADTIEYITSVLEEMGVEGKQAQGIINKCFSDKSSLKQYSNQLEVIAAKIENQREKIEQLKAAKDRHTKSGYYEAADKEAESLANENVKLMELEVQYDKAYLAQDNYVKKTVTSYQKQEKAAEQVTEKQEQLNQKLSNRQAMTNFSGSVNLATTALRSFDSVFPDIVSGIGEIITQVNSAKQAMLSGVSAPLAWATAIVAAVGIVANLIAQAAEKRRQEEEEAIQAAAEVAEASKQEREEVESLAESYVSLAGKLSAGNTAYSESLDIK